MGIEVGAFLLVGLFGVVEMRSVLLAIGGELRTLEVVVYLNNF